MANISSYPHGFLGSIVIKGLPLLQLHPGKVHWVNGTSVLAEGGIGGSNGNDGTYRRPYATIDFAVGKAVANRGDIIVVMPGHSEDIASATSLVVDVAGIAIVGLGTGSLRPDLNYSATAGSLELDAADVTLYNLTLTADVSAVVVGVNVDADGITISNCEWNYNATGDDFITMIDIDTVTGTVLENCILRAEDTAGSNEAIRLDVANETIISGNYIYGDYTDGAIIGEGAASIDLLIKDNTIYNSDTTAGFVVDLNVACTGILSGNHCGTLFATAPETALDPGSLLCLENYVVNAVDESGAIVPVTIST